MLGASKELATKMRVEILIMDADLILGGIHIESAVEHADRAFERETNVSSTRMLEVMLYASGERQLSTAIAKMGVKKETRHVAVVVSEPERLNEVFKELGIKRDDSVLEGSLEKLSAFGISERAVKSVGREKAMELVLERVSMVDLIK